MIDAMRDFEGEIAVLIRQVLKLRESQMSTLSRTELAEWDSLKHMELIFALEDRYGVQFDESEFPLLTSTGAIAAALRRHRAA